jgi:hypothetical protein
VSSSGGVRQVAALFDSVYLSFYKGVGAAVGAMLCGTGAFTTVRQGGASQATPAGHAAADICVCAWRPALDAIRDLVLCAQAARIWRHRFGGQVRQGPRSRTRLPRASTHSQPAACKSRERSVR